MSAHAAVASVGSQPLRAVLLAFEFPPLASGGVHRSLGFARTLPSCGVELDVVTLRETDYARWSAAPLDGALAARIPSEVRIHRISSGFPNWYWTATSHRFGFRLAQYSYWGDPVAVFWRRPLFDLLDRLITERRPDVFLATAPPFGVAVLARLAGRRYQLPWVVDFRDAWSRWCVAPYPTIGHYWYAKRTERALLREANVAVATSHVTRAEWLLDTPDLKPDRLHTIYNGFDNDRVDDIDSHSTRGAEPAAREIVYVGSFYYTPEARAATYRPIWRRRPDQWLQYRLRREDWLYRSPYFFLRGLHRLRERAPELAARLRVTFVGAVPRWLPAMLSETRTEDLVTLVGIVPHAEALRRQRRATAVLLTSAKIEQGRDCSIAGKTFEYFAARQPILALVTDGATRDLVRESGLGVFADPDNPEDVADALQRILLAEQPRDLVTPNEAFIRGFARPHIGAAMADCLRRAAAEGVRP